MKKKTRKPKQKKQLRAIVPLRELDVVIDVKGHAFSVAQELSALGLYVTHVLDKTGSVSGWCTHNALRFITSHPSIVAWGLNDE